jgi:hypothetical protein
VQPNVNKSAYRGACDGFFGHPSRAACAACTAFLLFYPVVAIAASFPLPLAGLVLLPPFLQDLASEACALLALRQLGRRCRLCPLEGGTLFLLGFRELPGQRGPARFQLVQSKRHSP